MQRMSKKLQTTRKEDVIKESIDILFNNTAFNVLRVSHFELEKLGLFKGQPPLFEALYRQDGLTQKQICDTLKLTPATVSKMLSRLEKKGFIKVCANSDDLRSKKFFLTEKAHALKPQIRKVNQTISERMLKGFSMEEEEQLRKLLFKIRKNFQE